MASAAQTGIALSNVIVKVSESLEKLEKFKLKKLHQDFFDTCSSRPAVLHGPRGNFYLFGH
jgi:hypothetical protein